MIQISRYEVNASFKLVADDVENGSTWARKRKERPVLVETKIQRLVSKSQ